MLYTPYMNHINQMSRSRFLLTVWSYQWIQWPQLWQRFNYDNELRSTNWQQLTRLLLTQQSCFHTAMFWCEVSKLLARPTLAHRMTNLLVFLSSDKAGGGRRHRVANCKKVIILWWLNTQWSWKGLFPSSGGHDVKWITPSGYDSSSTKWPQWMYRTSTPPDGGHRGHF